MRIDFKTCSVDELWKFVASHLEKRRIGVVLVGGAVVSLYSAGAYVSGDLDFVKDALVVPQNVDAAMAEIGFRKRGRSYVHAECSHLFVEFVSGPLGVGADTRIEPRKVEVDGVTIKVLSPTDCVRDRLAGFIHQGTRDLMEQAVLVARSQRVNWAVIERWASGEGPGGPEAYAELRRLAGR